ncbi:MAG: segregation and condensation protein A [Phycisphaerae bacterium]
MSDYRVQTDVYSGPMELLLYLIRRDEVDLYDIPVARITQQYCEYIEMLRVIDPNVAGDFLVMATVLLELKSRILLPRQPDDADEPEDLADPRLELVRQLLEYKKFKDASFELTHAAEDQSRRWPRVPVRPSAKPAAEVDLEDVQIWDLVAAFNKIMSAIGAGPASHDVVFDDTPISLHAADILDRLEREGGGLTFDALFDGRTKVEMIGLFLALLELMRQSRVRVVQESPAEAIRIELLSAEPIEVGEEWGAPFREAVLGSVANEEVAGAPPPAAPPAENDSTEAGLAPPDRV